MHPNDGRVIANFIIQALQNLDITIYGDGQQTRSFCYVDDLIDGLISMMNSPKGFTGPINIGNPEEFKMLDLVDQVLELTGSDSKVVFLPLPQDDPKRRQPNITLANENLNWMPRIKLQDGLKLTIDYFNFLKRSNRL